MSYQLSNTNIIRHFNSLKFTKGILSDCWRKIWKHIFIRHLKNNTIVALLQVILPFCGFFRFRKRILLLFLRFCEIFLWYLLGSLQWYVKIRTEEPICCWMIHKNLQMSLKSGAGWGVIYFRVFLLHKVLQSFDNLQRFFVFFQRFNPFAPLAEEFQQNFRFLRLRRLLLD